MTLEGLLTFIMAVAIVLIVVNLLLGASRLIKAEWKMHQDHYRRNHARKR